jgi:hypothetical protein
MQDAILRFLMTAFVDVAEGLNIVGFVDFETASTIIMSKTRKLGILYGLLEEMGALSDDKVHEAGGFHSTNGAGLLTINIHEKHGVMMSLRGQHTSLVHNLVCAFADNKGVWVYRCADNTVYRLGNKPHLKAVTEKAELSSRVAMLIGNVQTKSLWEAFRGRLAGGQQLFTCANKPVRDLAGTSISLAFS